MGVFQEALVMIFWLVWQSNQSDHHSKNYESYKKKILIAAWLAGEKKSFLNENLWDFKKIDMVELLLSSCVNLTWKKTLRKNFYQNLDTLQ